MSIAEIQKNEVANGQNNLDKQNESEKKLTQSPEQFQNETEANTALSGVESQKKSLLKWLMLWRIKNLSSFL